MSDFKKKWKDFHAGHLSQEAAIEFLKSLDNKETTRLFGEYLAKQWDEESSHDDVYQWDNKKIFEKIVAGKNEKKRKTNITTDRTKENFLLQSIKWAAAIFLVLISWQFSEHILNNDHLGSVGENEVAAVNWIVKSNPNGRKSKIILPDNSVISLNAGSKITYRDDFTTYRRVWLEGEAFFEVAKDSLHPFSVQTGRIVTTALGTSFNINAYNEHHVNVGLSTGRLMVSDSLTHQDIRLLPGEGARFSAQAPVITKHVIDPEKISWWKEGILHFEKIPFKDLIEILETWYGVEIEINGQVPDNKCSGTFKKNEFLSNVLKVLSHSVGFSYRIDGKNITIQT